MLTGVTSKRKVMNTFIVLVSPSKLIKFSPQYETSYWCEDMNTDVGLNASRCINCQQIAVEHKKRLGSCNIGDFNLKMRVNLGGSY